MVPAGLRDGFQQHGYVVAVTEATVEEIRHDAKFSEMRGWTIAIEDSYTAVEDEAWQCDLGGCELDIDEMDETTTRFSFYKNDKIFSWAQYS